MAMLPVRLQPLVPMHQLMFLSGQPLPPAKGRGGSLRILCDCSTKAPPLWDPDGQMWMCEDGVRAQPASVDDIALYQRNCYVFMYSKLEGV